MDKEKVDTSMAVSVVGNGPSKGLFVPAEHAHKLTIGCNRSEGCRWVSVYDKKCIGEVNGRKYRITRPVILCGNAAEESLNQPDIYRRLVVIGIVRKHPLRIHNAGVGAILWSLRAGLTPELYGFDSLFTKLRTTDSDQYWPRSKDLIHAPPAWEKSWHNLFEKYKDLVINVHAPEGAKLKMKGLNGHFKIIHHKPVADSASGVTGGE